MNTPPPTGNPTVWLTLQAHDAAALIDYYTTTFGFVVAARCDGDGDTVAHAELHWPQGTGAIMLRSEEHTSELQSRGHLVCRLLLEKKKKLNRILSTTIYNK